MTRCTYDPKALLGYPIGQHHCPKCGCMQVAGFQHAACEDECAMQDDDDRAIWKEAMTDLDPLADTSRPEE